MNMESLIALLFLASMVLLIIGLISPNKSLFWYKNERTKKKSALIYGVLMLAFIILAGISSDKNKKGNSSTTDNSGQSEPEAEQSVEKTAPIGIGQVLHTEYFDVTVNKVKVKDRVDTGNQFADLAPESGNMYLIMNTSFKNTDKESRMLTDGSIWISYNGKEYEFDKAETIMLDGWGLLLDQINPLTTKTTNLVYKIPAEIKGAAYFQPGRSDNDKKILLGTL